MDKTNNIQLTPQKVIKDATCVWSKHTDDTDIQMDLDKLTFKEGSLDNIFSFNVLDHFFMNECVDAVKNWRSCLKKNGELFITVKSFEEISRKYIGGEILIDDINSAYALPCHFDRQNLVNILTSAGFVEDKMKFWFGEVPNLFKGKDFDLIISATKHE